MLGTFRLILAASVALSHIGVNWGDIWISVIAVVIFYMISGYAMTGLILTRFSDQKRFSRFYLERVVRLAPQYYFWLAFAIITSVCLKWYPYEINLAGFVPYGLFSYITVIPLGMQRYFGSVDALVMPQATTLGIEISFYIISPWLLQSRKLSWIASLICLGVFLMTMLEILPANIFTYFKTPGPMIFYLLGSFLYKKDWLSLGAFTVALVAMLVIGLPQRFNMEFLLGLIIGLPIILFLIQFPANKLDSALGNASYGCYLGHGVVFF